MGRLSVRANSATTQKNRIQKKSISVGSTTTEWPSFGGLTTNLSGARLGIVSGTLPAATASNVLSSNISNLIASYEGSTFSGTTWTDDVGTYDTSAYRGTPSISSTTLNGYDILEGTTADGLQFPTAILPTTFTLFHVTRYNGTERRIFDGITKNWLNGFWNGLAGVAYHNGWLTSSGIDYEGTNWVISSSQDGLYRSNGIQRSTAVGGNTNDRLSINYGAHVAGETSDWQCAEVIVFDKELSATEIDDVEQYLSYKYNLPLNGIVATSWPYGGTYGSPANNQIFDTITTSLTSANTPTYSFGKTISIRSTRVPVSETTISRTNKKIFSYNSTDQFNLQALRDAAGETVDYTKARAIISDVSGGGGATADPESWE